MPVIMATKRNGESGHPTLIWSGLIGSLTLLVAIVGFLFKGDHEAIASADRTLQTHGERLSTTETLMRTVLDRLDRIDRKLDRALERE